LIERSTEARLLLLALCGREHLLFLGPPGTAKSELCRRLSSACSLSYFERTLTRFSTPEELFGPLSLAALERDEFRRATRGYAPEAELLFVDEVFKASSAILNTMLTILNERLFDDGAG
jgi:MoxR-like ATPase